MAGGRRQPFYQEKTLVLRDLRVYADTLEGKLYHYRDSNGLECNTVLHRRNGQYAYRRPDGVYVVPITTCYPNPTKSDPQYDKSSNRSWESLPFFYKNQCWVDSSPDTPIQNDRNLVQRRFWPVR